MGVWNAHTSLGNIFGGFIGGAFVDYDWALTFIVPAAMIAFVGIIVFIFLFPCKNSSLSTPSQTRFENLILLILLHAFYFRSKSGGF